MAVDPAACFVGVKAVWLYVANTAASSNRIDIKRTTDLSRNAGNLVEH